MVGASADRGPVRPGARATCMLAMGPGSHDRTRDACVAARKQTDRFVVRGAGAWATAVRGAPYNMVDVSRLRRCARWSLRASDRGHHEQRHGPGGDHRPARWAQSPVGWRRRLGGGSARRAGDDQTARHRGLSLSAIRFAGTAGRRALYRPLERCRLLGPEGRGGQDRLVVHLRLVGRLDRHELLARTEPFARKADHLCPVPSGSACLFGARVARFHGVCRPF